MTFGIQAILWLGAFVSTVILLASLLDFSCAYEAFRVDAGRRAAVAFVWLIMSAIFVTAAVLLP